MQKTRVKTGQEHTKELLNPKILELAHYITLGGGTERPQEGEVGGGAGWGADRRRQATLIREDQNWVGNHQKR